MSREDMFEGRSASGRRRVKNEVIIGDDEKVYKIKISDIVAPNFHDHSYMSRAGIDELADNIKEAGRILNPITVRDLGDGRYERIAGARRIEAVKQLGWSEIDGKILEVTEEEAVLLMISENLQREDINAYDEVYSILQYISMSRKASIDDTLSLLNRIRNYYSGNVNLTPLLEKQIKEIECSLKKVAKYQLGGFLNKLKVLNLVPPLIEAMRKDNLAYSYAILINQVRFDMDYLKELIDKTLKREINYDLLKELVKQKKEENKTKGASLSYEFEQIKSAKKLLSRKYISSLSQDKQNKVYTLLKELNLILEKD
ncbi:MAG TPA: ParB/RepB/Spo0J family partition protein [Epsilonproteobacteria bacterium]|nr:ParB/RepB/Spo0J family partition protein [Campylobacterota bacterium]